MLDELMCMDLVEGEKKISLAKVGARAIYLLGGVGAAMATYHIKKALSNDKK